MLLLGYLLQGRLYTGGSGQQVRAAGALNQDTLTAVSCQMGTKEENHWTGREQKR